MGNYLIGSYSARFDKSGRIKIPEKFRAAIEEQYGKELFITSLDGQAVQIYPFPVWKNLTGTTEEGLNQLKPRVMNFMRQVNRQGSYYEIDAKGRVLINQSLKDKAKLETEVEIVGLNNHLEVWNKTLLNQTIAENPLTDEDFEEIAELKSRGDPG